MIAGGSLNTKVFQADLNEIQSGQANSPSLLRLPLLKTFYQITALDNAAAYGGRPDISTQNGANPIVGNMANGAQIRPYRIALPQPTNCIQLVWHALDPGGNYECSYPLNSPNNFNGTLRGWPLAAFAGGGHWAMGWLRLNGLGPWFPMSLFNSTDQSYGGTNGNYLTAYPFGGFSSITGPMSFVDWMGYWDGVGDIGTGPMGGNAYVLAIASSNLALSSNGNSLGLVNNYAVPSGSGAEVIPPNTDTIRNQDILVRGTPNGR